MGIGKLKTTIQNKTLGRAIPDEIEGESVYNEVELPKSFEWIDEKKEREEKERVKNLILDTINKKHGEKRITEIKTMKTPLFTKFKLYLNTKVDNLLININQKISRIHTSIVNLWRSEQITIVKDLIKFVVIYGLLGTPVLLTVLTFFSANTVLVLIIKESWELTLATYFLGMGAGYYMMLDIMKAFEESKMSKIAKRVTK